MNKDTALVLHVCCSYCFRWEECKLHREYFIFFPYRYPFSPSNLQNKSTKKETIRHCVTIWPLCVNKNKLCHLAVPKKS